MNSFDLMEECEAKYKDFCLDFEDCKDCPYDKLFDCKCAFAIDFALKKAAGEE